MILDDWQSFVKIDPSKMLDEIDRLPDQLAQAWELGQAFDLPRWKDIDGVVIVGMGGSGIGADLFQAFAAPLSEKPVQIWRNYDLPAFVSKRTLVILSSHSGNTEEILSAFERALEIGAKAVAISTGGELSRLAGQHSVPLLRFVHAGQPRAAIGY